MVCFAFVGICVSVHKVFSHFSHSDRLKSHESADREESEELCDDAAVILSLSGTSSIILDRNGQIVRSSPDTYRLGAVGNDSIVSGEILEAVEKVRETGNPEEFDLTTYTPGEFRDSEFIGSAFSESEKKKYALAEHIHRLRVSVARLSGGIIAILLDDRSGQAKSERMHLEFVEKTAKTMEMQADRVARAVEKIHDVSDMTYCRMRKAHCGKAAFAERNSIVRNSKAAESGISGEKQSFARTAERNYRSFLQKGGRNSGKESEAKCGRQQSKAG